MTLECLPELVQDSLRKFIRAQEFSLTCDINLKKTACNQISSSCKIKISDSAKQLCLFLKYLDNHDHYFGPEGVVYFKNELVFYGDILELFKGLHHEKIPFAPECLQVGGISAPNPFIVMADLHSGGFLPLEVKEFSVEFARATFQQLGRFHAYSLAIKDQRPQAFADATSKLCETVFRRDTRGTLGKLFIHAIHDVFKLAKQSLPSNSVYVEKFAAFTLDIFDRMAALAQGDNDDEEYKVITHGDLWPNNILHKLNHDSKSIDCITFIDYQACRLASPIHDLMFLLLVGLDKPTREQNRHELIEHYYHKSLCETLEKLGSDPLRLLPYSALQHQLLKHTQFALALALVGLPLFLNEGLNSTSKGATHHKTNEGDDNSNLDTLLEFVHELQTNKSMRCKNKMLEIIMDVVDYGYL